MCCKHSGTVRLISFHYTHSSFSHTFIHTYLFVSVGAHAPSTQRLHHCMHMQYYTNTLTCADTSWLRVNFLINCNSSTSITHSRGFKSICSTDAVRYLSSSHLLMCAVTHAYTSNCVAAWSRAYFTVLLISSAQCTCHVYRVIQKYSCYALLISIKCNNFSDFSSRIYTAIFGGGLFLWEDKALHSSAWLSCS